MTSDPRSPDDGLAELVDELERRVDFEAWRPRYVVSWDGGQGSESVALLNLTTGQVTRWP